MQSMNPAGYGFTVHPACLLRRSSWLPTRQAVKRLKRAKDVLSPSRREASANSCGGFPQVSTCICRNWIERRLFMPLKLV